MSLSQFLSANKSNVEAIISPDSRSILFRSDNTDMLTQVINELNLKNQKKAFGLDGDMATFTIYSDNVGRKLFASAVEEVNAAAAKKPAN